MISDSLGGWWAVGDLDDNVVHSHIRQPVVLSNGDIIVEALVDDKASIDIGHMDVFVSHTIDMSSPIVLVVRTNASKYCK